MPGEEDYECRCSVARSFQPPFEPLREDVRQMRMLHEEQPLFGVPTREHRQERWELFRGATAAVSSPSASREVRALETSHVGPHSTAGSV